MILIRTLSKSIIIGSYIFTSLNISCMSKDIDGEDGVFQQVSPFSLEWCVCLCICLIGFYIAFYKPDATTACF